MGPEGPAGEEIAWLEGSRRSFGGGRLSWLGSGRNRCLSWLLILGVSESSLWRWLKQADVDEGAKPGLTSDEREELAQLRRENRVLRMERDLLSRAAAFFASENVRPK